MCSDCHVCIPSPLPSKKSVSVIWFFGINLKLLITILSPFGAMTVTGAMLLTPGATAEITLILGESVLLLSMHVFFCLEAIWCWKISPIFPVYGMWIKTGSSNYFYRLVCFSACFHACFFDFRISLLESQIHLHVYKMVYVLSLIFLTIQIRFDMKENKSDEDERYSW